LLVQTLQIGVKYLIVSLPCHAYVFAQNQQYFNIFCLRMKHYCTDRFSIPAWDNMANNSGKP